MTPANTLTARSASKRTWSLELMLVIGLPLAAVVASFVTLALAMRSPAHHVATVQQVDRFGHVVGGHEHESSAP